MVLAMFAACGLVYSIIILINRGAGAHRIALRALDLITIVCPSGEDFDVALLLMSSSDCAACSACCHDDWNNVRH